MKIGLRGLIMSDFTKVNYDKLRWAADLGFHGVSAHRPSPHGLSPTHWMPTSGRSLPTRACHFSSCGVRIRASSHMTRRSVGQVWKEREISSVSLPNWT